MGALPRRGADGGNPVCRVRRAVVWTVWGGLSLGEWKRSGEPPLDLRGGLKGRAGMGIPVGGEEWGRLGRPKRRLGEWRTRLVRMRARDTCSYCRCHPLRPKGTGERNRS